MAAAAAPPLFVFIDLDNLVFHENAEDIPRFRARVVWLCDHLPGKKLWFSNESTAQLIEREAIELAGRLFVSPNQNEAADHALVAKIWQTFRHAPETPTVWVITHDHVLQKLIRYQVYPHRMYVHYAEFNAAADLTKERLQRAPTVDFHFETRLQLEKFLKTYMLLRERLLDRNAEALIKKQKGGRGRCGATPVSKKMKRSRGLKAGFKHDQ